MRPVPRGQLGEASPAHQKRRWGGGHLSPHQRTRNLGHPGCPLALKQLVALCYPPSPPHTNLRAGGGAGLSSSEHDRTGVLQGRPKPMTALGMGAKVVPSIAMLPKWGAARCVFALGFTTGGSLPEGPGQCQHIAPGRSHWLGIGPRTG